MVYYKKCEYCGKTYTGFRSSGKFCSTSCRVQSAKLPLRMKQKADAAIDYVAQMRELAEKYPEQVNELDNQLQRLQEKIAMVRLTLPQIVKSKSSEAK